MQIVDIVHFCVVNATHAFRFTSLFEHNLVRNRKHEGQERKKNRGLHKLLMHLHLRSIYDITTKEMMDKNSDDDDASTAILAPESLPHQAPYVSRALVGLRLAAFVMPSLCCASFLTVHIEGLISFLTLDQ